MCTHHAGAKTPLAQCVCGIVVGFVLLFLTGLFSHLPFNVLGAIVIVSVGGLVEIEQAIYLWKVRRSVKCTAVWLTPCHSDSRTAARPHLLARYQVRQRLVTVLPH